MKIDFYFDKPLRVVSPNFETSFIGWGVEALSLKLV